MTARFKEQDRVAILGDATPLRRGVFIGYIGTRLRAAVLLDNGNLEQVSIGDLVPAAQIAAEERRIQDEARRLQMDFETVREQIAEKMQIAANALREATKLAESHDETLQSSELWDEVRPFMRAFDDAGWSSSSLTC